MPEKQQNTIQLIFKKCWKPCIKYAKTYSTLILLFSCLLVFLAPLLIFPDQITNRNNDLLEFKQSFAFFKKTIQEHHIIPLWQNRTLSGSPYLGDPQNPILYLPNYLVLAIPLNYFFVLSFAAHFFIALLGTYLFFCALKFKKSTSICVAMIYAFSPKFTGHLEAGHVNLVVAYAWIPFVYYSLVQFKTKAKITHSMLLGYSLTAIFLNYITIFMYVVPTILVLMLSHLKIVKVKLHFILLSVVIFLLISLPQLVVALKYFPLSTRTLISAEDISGVVSIRHFIHSIISPYTYGLEKLGTEGVLTFGIMPVALSFIGFMIIPLRRKIYLLIISSAVVLITLGTKTSFFNHLIETFPALLIFRIPSRIWFILILIVAYLCAICINKIRNKTFVALISIAILVELSVFSYVFFKSHPNSLQQSSMFNEVSKSVNQDVGYYRVYCTVSCPITNLLENGKGFANGYNPIQLKNYFNLSQNAGGYRFNIYTLSIPPYQTYVDEPQPSSIEMGKLGVRYVVSPYMVRDKGFVFVGEADNQFIYLNKNELPRVYVVQDGNKIPLRIVSDKPGAVEVEIPNLNGQLVLNEPYFPFWEVKTQDELLSTNSADGLVSAKITNNHRKALIRFNPPFSKITVPLSLLTSLILILSVIKYSKRKDGN